MERFRKFLMDWWFSIPVFIAIVAIVATVLEPPTTDNPSGLAGMYAPLIALCTASTAFTQVIRPGGKGQRKFARIAIGLGSIISAYLWLASESKLHPASLEMLGGMGFIFFVAATVTVVVPMMLLLAKSHSHDQASGDDGQS